MIFVSYSMVFIASTLIATLLIPVFSYVAFKKGYEFGVKEWNASHPEKPKPLPVRQPRTTSFESDKELEKYATILENIENYDGTDAHQKEIM